MNLCTSVRSLLIEIPQWCKPHWNLACQVAQWERLVKDYESQAVAPVDEETKMAVV